MEVIEDEIEEHETVGTNAMFEANMVEDVTANIKGKKKKKKKRIIQKEEDPQ